MHHAFGLAFGDRHEDERLGMLIGRRRPRRLGLVAERGGDRPGVSGGRIEHPDVVGSAAIGRERDPGPIRRPRRLPVVEAAGGEGDRLPAVERDLPQIPGSGAVGLDRRPVAVRVDIGKAVVAEPVGQGLGRSPGRRQPPQRPLQVEDEGLPIGRRGDGEAGALLHPDGAFGSLLRGGRERGSHRRRKRQNTPDQGEPLHSADASRWRIVLRAALSGAGRVGG